MRKNKILKIFIAIMLLVSIQTSVIAASTGIVNVDTVRVRKKATTQSGIVALVSIGDKVTITGEEGDWYKVKAKDEDGNSVEGYIRKDLLKVDEKTVEVEPNQKEEKEPEQQQEPQPNNTTQTEETPNQTEEPATTGGETPQEEEPTENEEQPNENRTGVIEQDTEISTIKITGGVSTGKKVQLTKETKIKILPLANSSNIAKLEANTEVTVLEVINKWCRIEAGEYTGWVRIDQ